MTIYRIISLVISFHNQKQTKNDMIHHMLLNRISGITKANLYYDVYTYHNGDMKVMQAT